MRRNIVIWGVMGLLSIPSAALAVGSGGISIEIASAEGLASLTQIAGSPNDPAVVYMNPASMSLFEDFAVTGGIAYLTLSAERNGQASIDKMKTTEEIVPNFSSVFGRRDSRFAFGIALVSPYGLSTKWAESSNVRYVATKSTIKMFDLTPAVSYRASKSITAGFGLDYFSTVDADLQKKVAVDVVNFVLGSPTLGAPDANSKLSGDGDAWGYHAGVLYTPASAHTIGITYHSEVKTKIEGDLEITGLSGASAIAFGGIDFKTAVRTDLFYPQSVQFGYKYNKSDKWELGINSAWYDWSSNKQLEIQMADATPIQRAIAGNPIPLNWKDVWSITVGGHYRFSESFKVNGGIYYLPAVYPESTFTPAVPDMNKIGISVGPSYSRGAWAVDTVYNPIFYRSTTITNTVGQDSTGLASADISGKYKATVHIIGINVRYRYGG